MDEMVSLASDPPVTRLKIRRVGFSTVYSVLVGSGIHGYGEIDISILNIRY